MKRCRSKSCPLPQPLKPSQFNKSSTSEDGLQNICKVCQSRANSRMRKQHPDHARLKARRYQLLYPERYKAIQRVRYAIRRGYIKRTPCKICGSTPTEMFLDEPYTQYGKPWDKCPPVAFYCHMHHPRKASVNDTITYEEFD